MNVRAIELHLLSWVWLGEPTWSLQSREGKKWAPFQKEVTLWSKYAGDGSPEENRTLSQNPTWQSQSQVEPPSTHCSPVCASVSQHPHQFTSYTLCETLVHVSHFCGVLSLIPCYALDFKCPPRFTCWRLCYWEVVELLGCRAYLKELRPLWVYSWRGYWDPDHILFFIAFQSPWGEQHCFTMPCSPWCTPSLQTKATGQLSMVWKLWNWKPK
jgi:hypothetical protein